jgi:hypothetical protein
LRFGLPWPPSPLCVSMTHFPVRSAGILFDHSVGKREQPISDAPPHSPIHGAPSLQYLEGPERIARSV